VDGKKVEYITTAGTDGDAFKSLPDYIARELAKKLKVTLPATEWKVRYRPGDSVIWLYRVDGDDFAAEVKDSNAGNNLVLVTNEIDRFDRLPSVAPNDFLVKVAGDVGEQRDDYYIRFQTDDNVGEFGPGSWEESTAPGIPYQFDESTMPHVLERLEGIIDNTEVTQVYFRFRPATSAEDGVGWRTRLVGDELTNKEPSFVGSYIEDVFFHRNRLGFVSRTNVILSRAGDFFDFWRFTALSLNDDDRIDVDSARQSVSVIHHAVSYAEELLLFADKTQLVLRGSDTLTPKTASIVAATEYAFDPAAEPVNAENVLFFANARGSYSDVHEYFIDIQSSVKTADNLCEHIPKYIPGRIIRLSSSPAAKQLVALADGARNKLFAYQWARNGNQKVLSSWSEWQFGDDPDTTVILAAEYVEEALYLVIRRECGLYLERMDVTAIVDDDAEYLTHLDRRLVLDANVNQLANKKYDPLTDTTTLHLPYKPTTTPMVVTKSDSSVEGWIGGIVVPVQQVTNCPPEITPEPEPEPEPELATIRVLASTESIQEDEVGYFQFFRTGDTSAELSFTVAYSGSANNPADYTLSPSGTTLTFAAGSSSLQVEVAAVDDGSLEGPETVTVTLQPDLGVYEVGQPAAATIVIRDDNDAPTCTPADFSTAPFKEVRIRFSGIVNPGPVLLGAEGGVGASTRYVEWSAALEGFEVVLPDTWYTGGDLYFDIPGSWMTEHYVVSSDDYSGPMKVRIGGQALVGGKPSFQVQIIGYRSDPAPPDHVISGVFDSGGSIVLQTCTPYENVYLEPNMGPGVYNNSGSGGVVVAYEDGSGPPPPTIPAAPTLLTATTISETQIDLAWTDNSSDEDLFYIERSPDGSTWAQIGTVQPNIAAFANVNLQSATQYYYRVRAGNAAGYSTYSNTANATTDGEITPPQTEIARYATGEEVNNGTCNYVDLQWTVNGVSAFLHHVPNPPNEWGENEDDVRWISYSADTSLVSESATTRDFRTVVDIGGDFPLEELAMSGDAMVAGDLIDILVNGTSTGNSQIGEADAATEWRGFTLAANLFRHGPNTITFKVRSIPDEATGLKVRWVGPVQSDLAARYIEVEEDLTGARDEEDGDLFVEADRSTEDELVEPLALGATSSEADPCLCTYKLVLKGRWLSNPIYIGEPYEFRYRVSPIYIRATDSGSVISAYTGRRLQITTAVVNFANSGTFKVEVTPLESETSVYHFSGRTIGSPFAHVGEAPVETGHYQFLVMGRNNETTIDFVNDSFMPSWFQSLDWIGKIEPLATRL
jgi:hypothetical protein